MPLSTPRYSTGDSTLSGEVGSKEGKEKVSIKHKLWQLTSKTKSADFRACSHRITDPYLLGSLLFVGMTRTSQLINFTNTHFARLNTCDFYLLVRQHIKACFDINACAFFTHSVMQHHAKVCDCSTQASKYQLNLSNTNPLLLKYLRKTTCNTVLRQGSANRYWSQRKFYVKVQHLVICQLLYNPNSQCWCMSVQEKWTDVRLQWWQVLFSLSYTYI